MPGARCTRSPCAKGGSTRSSPQVTGTPGIPCAMVLTAYSALSPATNSSCHRRRRIEWRSSTRSGVLRLHRLDTSNGCQDHTALPYAIASLVWRAFIAHGKPPCDVPRATTLPRPPHPAPNVRDDGQRPSVRARDGGKYAGDLGRKKTELFLSGGLDRANHLESSRQIRIYAQGGRTGFFVLAGHHEGEFSLSHRRNGNALPPPTRGERVGVRGPLNTF